MNFKKALKKQKKKRKTTILFLLRTAPRPLQFTTFYYYLFLEQNMYVKNT